MYLLVSRVVVKQALRIEHSDHDDMLDILISAASRSVARYISDRAGVELGVDSPLEMGDSPPNDMANVPEDARLAVIALTGHYYRSPDADPDKVFADNDLPLFVKALLYPLRDPTIA